MDVNGNSVYDGPNGVWDANTTIWTEGHLVFTDAPTGTVTLVQPGRADDLGFNVAQNFTVRWQDENLNEPAPLFTRYRTALTIPAEGTFVRRADRAGQRLRLHVTDQEADMRRARVRAQHVHQLRQPAGAGRYLHRCRPRRGASGFTRHHQLHRQPEDARDQRAGAAGRDLRRPCDTTSASPWIAGCRHPASQSLLHRGRPRPLWSGAAKCCVANQQAGGRVHLEPCGHQRERQPGHPACRRGLGLTLTATLNSTAMASDGRRRPRP